MESHNESAVAELPPEVASPAINELPDPVEPGSFADAIESAVIFYTGGGCEFYYTGEKRKTYWCEFGGYYANGMEG